VDVLDLVIVVLAFGAAVGGYRLGFLGRVASWLGLALGFYIAVLVLPKVIIDLSRSSPGVQLVVAVLLLVGGAVIGQAIGLVIGSWLHGVLPLGPVRQVDRVFGAGIGLVGVVAALWLLLPSVSSVPGWPARATTGSTISRWVSAHLPPPPDALQVLRRMIGQDAPQVFAVLHPGAGAGPTPTASPLSAAVTSAVVNSTVKVTGQACDRIYEGSGFTVAPDLVATNAHVVAGEPPGQTTVLLPNGRQLPAKVVMFDARRDLALLDVSGLDETPLSLQSPSAGLTGAVFGHPGGQDHIAVTPARVAREETAVGRDLYDRAITRRQILVLAAALAHGDSGGPLVNDQGAVIGIAFAISADQPTTSYALNTSELRAALAEPRQSSGASTGSCLTG
jgi:S1-C subfamily serine protease